MLALLLILVIVLIAWWALQPSGPSALKPVDGAAAATNSKAQAVVSTSSTAVTTNTVAAPVTAPAVAAAAPTVTVTAPVLVTSTIATPTPAVVAPVVPAIRVASVTDPLNMPVWQTMTPSQVLTAGSNGWNPMPVGNGSTNGRVFKLLFKFNRPTNVKSVSVSLGGDTTHDTKVLNVYKDGSFADASLVKSYNPTIGTANMQVFTLQSPVNTDTIGLSFQANTQWQVYVRQVSFETTD